MQYTCQQLTGIVTITDLCLMDGITIKVMFDYELAVLGTPQHHPIRLGLVAHSLIQV